MISVTLDEEIVEEFKYRAIQNRIAVGKETVFLNGEWVYGERGNWVFATPRYDNEFTEWLKENRPEVFL